MIIYPLFLKFLSLPSFFPRLEGFCRENPSAKRVETSALSEVHRYDMAIAVLSLLDWFGKYGCLVGKRPQCVP